MEVKSAKELSTKNVTYLIYSGPGGGKTHTINFLSGKTLYVPVDRSEIPLKGNENIDVVTTFDPHDAWKSWGQLMKDLANADLSKYENIVIDNISELTRSMLGNLGRDGNNNRVPTQANYQQIDFFLIDSFRFLQTLGKRLVFTAWETTDKWDLPSGQQVNRAFPDIRMKIMNNFMGLCQVVGRLVMNPETGNRGFLLTPSTYVYAKNQLDDREFCSQEDIFEIGKKTNTNNEGEQK